MYLMFNDLIMFEQALCSTAFGKFVQRALAVNDHDRFESSGYPMLDSWVKTPIHKHLNRIFRICFKHMGDRYGIKDWPLLSSKGIDRQSRSSWLTYCATETVRSGDISGKLQAWDGEVGESKRADAHSPNC